MIKSIEFKDYKILRQTTLPLGRLTVIVGPHGAGKSTALTALERIKNPGSSDFNKLAPASILKAEDSLVALTARLDDPEAGLRINWTSRLGIEEKWSNSSGGQLDWEKVSQFKTRFQKIALYSLQPNQLKQPTGITLDFQINPEGHGLAGALDWLRNNEETRFDKLNEEIRKGFPEFHGISFGTSSYGSRAFFLKSRTGRFRIEANDLSDGILLTLGLLALSFQPNLPPVIAFDNPDKGIQPSLLPVIGQALDRIAYPERFGEDRPSAQVVATTVSPEFASLFHERLDEVVFAIKTDSQAYFKQAIEQPDLAAHLRPARHSIGWQEGPLASVVLEPN